jgi:hypothetical protein
MTPPAAAVAAPPVRRARTAAPARPLSTPPRPRRVSGPTRKRAAVNTPQMEGLAVGVIAALRNVDGSPLLDRLIRGRVWIGLVAFALIGIVTLQLTLLKLNAGIGRALAQETTLERQNAALSIENSERAAGNLVESSAASLGMQLVPAGALQFLTVQPKVDAARAAAALKTPVNTNSATTNDAITSGEATSAATSETSSSASTTQSPGTSAEVSATGADTNATGPTETPSSSSGTANPAASPSGAGESSPAESSAGATGADGTSSGQAPTTPAGGTQAGPTG